MWQLCEEEEELEGGGIGGYEGGREEEGEG